VHFVFLCLSEKIPELVIGPHVLKLLRRVGRGNEFTDLSIGGARGATARTSKNAKSTILRFFSAARGRHSADVSTVSERGTSGHGRLPRAGPLRSKGEG
jgi:hypothetical protein